MMGRERKQGRLLMWFNDVDHELQKVSKGKLSE